MPGRQANLGSYRYGFQNQETDPEMLGGAVAFTYRVHDARIGRFLSTDPFKMLIHTKSNYTYAGNSPIKFIDANGGFQMSEKDQKKYPQIRNILVAFSNLINDENTTVDHPLVSSFLIAAGYDVNQENFELVKEAFSFGSGPYVNVGRLKRIEGKKVAGFVASSSPAEKIDFNNRTININVKLEKRMKRYGNYKNAGDERTEYVIAQITSFITLWHEGIHYFDIMKDGISQSNIYDGNTLEIVGETSQEAGYYGEQLLFPRFEITDEKLKELLALSAKTTSFGVFTNGGAFNANEVEKFFRNPRLTNGTYVNRNGNQGGEKPGKKGPKKGSHRNPRFL